MANRIAGSGFSYKYLKAAYFGNPTEGIFNLLSEQVRNSSDKISEGDIID